MRRENQFVYMNIYEQLKEQIMTSVIKPGEYLLPESQLCALYNASRNSVRRALEQLQKEQLVEKRAGLGTMVPEHLVLTERPTLKILMPAPAHFVEYGFATIVQAFKEAYPQVEVQMLRLPAHEFWESLALSRDIGIAPDLVLMSDMQCTEWRLQESFADLTSFACGLAGKEQIPPKLLEPFTASGQLNAIPVTFTPVFLAGRMSMLAEAGVAVPANGWDLSQFEQAARQLTRTSEGLIERFGFSFFSGVSRWPVFLLQRGFQTNVPLGQQADLLRETLGWVRDIVFRQRIAINYASAQSNGNPFLYGKAAMILTNLFEQAGWENRPEDMVVLPMHFGQTESTLLQSNALAIPQESANRPLAKAFMQVAFDMEVQYRMASQTPFLSLYEQVNLDAKGSAYLETIHADAAHIQRGEHLSRLFRGDFLHDLHEHMALYWLGLQSVDELMANLDLAEEA